MAKSTRGLYVLTYYSGWMGAEVSSFIQHFIYLPSNNGATFEQAQIKVTDNESVER